MPTPRSWFTQVRRSLLCLPLVALALSALRAAEPPPNVIVILADDLGYGDLSCYGSTSIATPRLDRMAREGVRFTDAYAAAPFCSPARAALLTGRLPARNGVPYVLFPTENHGLPAAETTLAEMLRARGYATACIGKWHLGWDAPFRPTAQGFERFHGLPHTNDVREWKVGEPFMQLSMFKPLSRVEGERVVESPVDQAELTRHYTEQAVAFIRAQRDRPFFLYLPHTMPHVPQYASPRFAGKSRGGLFGDTVEELDWSTGVILDTLRELRLDGRTLVIFTSDNGAPGRGGGGGAAKKAAKENFPGRQLAGSNGPLRAGKGSTYEGGVRIPFIAWWPGRIAPRGDVRDVVSHLDLLPTFAALAGAALPAGVTLDGRDISPALLGTAALTVRPLYHYFGYQAQAVREGRWKLMLATDRRPDPRPASLWWDHQPNVFENQHRLLAAPELYDLESDLGEKQNVAAQHPDVVARLTASARAFDAALQRDSRPMQFVPAPPGPPPGTVRTATTDLTQYHNP
ncbi:sulfatase family protein [Horticoccus sp. 23ND18S-11]|uniref:sulfatase family protein n=1 Tax=Horticoccus sp. 23ND18S-11 TaxID=3391832 RepID=UPI0039C99D1E